MKIISILLLAASMASAQGLTTAPAKVPAIQPEQPQQQPANPPGLSEKALHAQWKAYSAEQRLQKKTARAEYKWRLTQAKLREQVVKDQKAIQAASR